MSIFFFQTKEAFTNLRDRLSSSSIVKCQGADEGETLAHAFSDLETTFRKLLDEHFPRLAKPTVDGEELEELLLDIGEEFRHVLYHIHDPKLFRAIEPTHEWLLISDEEASRSTAHGSEK